MFFLVVIDPFLVCASALVRDDECSVFDFRLVIKLCGFISFVLLSPALLRMLRPVCLLLL